MALAVGRVRAPFFFKSWSPVVAVILGGLMTGVGLDINVVFDMTILSDYAGTTPVMEMIAWMIVGTPVGAATALLGACARKTGWWSVAGTTVFGVIIAYGYYWEYSENYRVTLQLKGVSLWDNLTDYPQWIWAGVLAVINIVVLVRIARKGWTKRSKAITRPIEKAPATTSPSRSSPGR